MDKKQIIEVVKKRKTPIIIVTLALLAVIAFAFLFSSVERQGKEQQALSLEEQEQLTDMTTYLDEIDSVVVANQERLAEATLFQSDTEQILNTFKESLSVLEKDLTEIETSGNSNSGGGCYTVKKTGTKTYGCAGGDCISGPHGPDTSGQVYYVGNCKECGAHLSRYGSPGYQSCSNTKTSTYTYYELGCEKSTNTIVGYRVACGLADGQIIGAHIVYDESAVSSVSAAAVMCYEEVQEMPVYEPEGSTESTEDEPTVSGNEIEPEIEENVSEEPESEKVTEEVTEENESETEESMEDVTEESSDDEKTDMSQEQMQTEQTEPEGAVAEEVTETMVTEEIAEDIQTEVQEEE